MWLKLSTCYLNMNHIVRVEFNQDINRDSVTLISTKPGGSDRTILIDDDAKAIKIWLEHNLHTI
jgi:hypothetical protein